MTLRQKIWALPIAATLASMLGIVVNYTLSSSASKVVAQARSYDYAVLNDANSLSASLSNIEEGLQNAVSAGDKNALPALDAKAESFHELARQLGARSSEAVAAAGIDSEFQNYFAVARKAAAIMLGQEQGDVTAAVQSMQAAQSRLQETLTQFKHTALQRFEDHLRQSETVIHRQPIVSAVAGGLLVLGVALAAWFLIPSILRPIDQAGAIAKAMARGDLSEDIAVQGRDELAQLLGAMRDMVGSFNRFVAAQRELTDRHAIGEIEYVIPARDFPGIYGEMANSTNELARSHIAVTQRVLAVMTRYAVGDLSVDMEPLPGKQMEIKNACDGIKQNLQAINREIARLVEAASQGDFRARGNTQGFRFGYRNMIVDLNRLMQACDGGLNEIAQMLGALARGDLSGQFASEHQGTFAQLTADANTTVEKLRTIVAGLKSAASKIAAVSGEDGVRFARGSRHDSTFDAAAAALETLTATVRHNAEGAAQATQLALEARTLAETGGSVAERAVAAVEEINHSSRRIVDIIAVIDDIAFQTNLLALNAAVEAARAGEQGRGFAVVASEVRSLAGRSATAAKEIKGLIADSARKVENGSHLVIESGRKLREIVESVQKVTAIVGEISAASREQAHGIEQVNRTVTEMDRIMQANASELRSAVSVFKISRDDPASAEVASDAPQSTFG